MLFRSLLFPFHEFFFVSFWVQLFLRMFIPRQEILSTTLSFFLVRNVHGKPSLSREALGPYTGLRQTAFSRTRSDTGDCAPVYLNSLDLRCVLHNGLVGETGHQGTADKDNEYDQKLSVHIDMVVKMSTTVFPVRLFLKSQIWQTSPRQIGRASCRERV